METDAFRVSGQASQPQFLQATSPGKADRPGFKQSQKSAGHEDSINASQEVTFRFLSGNRQSGDLSDATVLRTNAYFGQVTIASTTFEQISLPNVIGVVLITLVLLLVACMFIEEDSDDKEPPGFDDRVNDGPAKPREELHAMETCDGTWAVTYQNAEGQSKQGLELLFRCHIIPTQEFAYAKVSQEHIDECVWIATHMLRKRPLEQWLDDWPHARDGFDDSVRKNFEERKNVRLEKQTGLKGSPDAEDAKSLEERRKLPFEGLFDKKAKGGTKAAALPTKEGRSGVLKIGDKKGLMDRCRQIMAASDAGRKPWSSKGSESSVSPQLSGGKTAAPKRPPGMNTTPPSTATALRGMASAASASAQKDERREANDAAAPAASKDI